MSGQMFFSLTFSGSILFLLSFLYVYTLQRVERIPDWRHFARRYRLTYTPKERTGEATVDDIQPQKGDRLHVVRGTFRGRPLELHYTLEKPETPLLTFHLACGLEGQAPALSENLARCLQDNFRERMDNLPARHVTVAVHEAMLVMEALPRAGSSLSQPLDVLPFLNFLYELADAVQAPAQPV